MTATSHPVMNLGAMRAMVRDITNIEATLVVTDARINQVLNEEVFNVVRSMDIEGQRLSASTVAIGAITYVYPGWSWETTNQYPIANASAVIYMNADADLAPWNSATYPSPNSGYYDRGIVYKAAARILRDQADDTTRADEFDKLGTSILEVLVRDEFVNWNIRLGNEVILNYPTDHSRNLIRLTLFAMQLLKQPVNYETSTYGDSFWLIYSSVANESVELHNAYKWPGTITTANITSWGTTVADIFAYGAAARLAPRYGLAEAEQKALLTDYETRKQSLLRDQLYNSSGSIQPYTFAGLKSQVRALLQDYTKDLPETLIGQWVNDAYQSLAYEREWRWLENEVTYLVPSGSADIDLLFGTRVLSVYEIKTDVNGDITESAQIYPVGHGYDVLSNASDYRYSVSPAYVNNVLSSDTVVTLYPTPNEAIKVAIRYVDSPATLTSDAAQTAIAPRFASIIAYRAALIGAAFHPQAKQLVPAYEAQAQRMYDAMLRHYQLDTSTETFSIGENALETRKYLPFFRVG